MRSSLECLRFIATGRSLVQTHQFVGNDKLIIMSLIVDTGSANIVVCSPSVIIHRVRRNK